MEKRGFALTFKWIFALVAGLIIFLFLINFAYKHIYLSEKTTSAILLTNLDTQLESLSVSEFLAKYIDLNEEFNINFNCNSLLSGEANIQTKKIIFSNKNIQARELSLFTQTWSYPFPVTNFFYIADKNTKFYFFDPPYDLISKIPEHFDVYTYPDEVPEDATLIFFRQPAPNELKNNIKIIQNNKITFYPGKTTNYYGDEMLLGAIFTDDYIKFNCLKQKALTKLKIISQVYQNKANTLAKYECTDKYQFIINLLNDFKTNPINPEAIENADKELERNGCTPLFQ